MVSRTLLPLLLLLSTACAPKGGAGASSSTSDAASNGNTPTIDVPVVTPVKDNTTVVSTTPGDYTWLGKNSSWSDPANWKSGKVPGATDDCVIGPTALGVLIDVPEATCRNLTLQAGGALSFAGASRTLVVTGELVVSPLFTYVQATNATLSLRKAGAQTFGPIAFPGTISVEQATAVVTLSGLVKAFTFTVNSGRVILPATARLWSTSARIAIRGTSRFDNLSTIHLTSGAGGSVSAQVLQDPTATFNNMGSISINPPP